MKIKDILNIIEKDKYYQMQMNCYATLQMKEKWEEINKEYEQFIESEIK